MFNGLSEILDWFNKLIWLIVALYLIFSCGIGFLIRLIAKPLKVDFNDIKTKKIDDHLLSLQLLRLYHGINVGSQSDKKIVFLAIKNNILSSRDFKLLYFMPEIGRRKHGAAEIIMHIFTYLAVILFVSLCFYSARGLKYDYSGFTEGSERVLISEVYVYEPTAKVRFTKAECKSLPEGGKEIVKSACHYLVSSDPDVRNELKSAIKQNNSTLVALLTTLALIYITTMFMIFAYIRFVKTNNAFVIFKELHGI